MADENCRVNLRSKVLSVRSIANRCSTASEPVVEDSEGVHDLTIHIQQTGGAGS